MTFRRLYTQDGIHNYFWKARPASEHPSSPSSARSSAANLDQEGH
jgi:hypothetical protein